MVRPPTFYIIRSHKINSRRKILIPTRHCVRQKDLLLYKDVTPNASITLTLYQHMKTKKTFSQGAFCLLAAMGLLSACTEDDGHANPPEKISLH